MRYAKVGARLCVAVGLMVGLVATMATPAAAQGKWERINKEEGIEVFRKEIAGRDMPMFRGRAVVKADLYTVLAVLSDFDRHTEWMHSCFEAGLLKEIDDLNRLSYNRADAPWPVSDRDVVLRSKVEIDRDKKRITIHFRGVKSPLKPEVEDVVRMKRLKGYYQLTAIDANTTRVQYQVDSDPGGDLPTWLAAKASEDIPLNTLRNLRK
ncbi:MAG: hypothetical protein CMH57_01915 [Myxococcales bacterium]|nr:hypothetical protein [Myxococcales bacterium]